VENITITILGKEYSIKSDVEKESLSKIAGHLNRKVDEIIKTAKTATVHNVLILAAMNIADEYFREKNLNQELISYVEGKSEQLLQNIKSRT
jgi:cell division protein ZapA